MIQSDSTKRISVIVVLAILAIGVGLGAYLFSRDPFSTSAEGKDSPIGVGAILPLSGSLAFMGKMEGDGMKLAVEDINAGGGIDGRPLQLALDDSQGKPDIAVTAAQKMMTVDDIDIIISSFSSVTLGLKPVVERNGGILIGANMHPDFYKNSPNVFRFYIGVEDESRGFVDYFREQQAEGKELRIGVLYVEAPNVIEQIEDYIEPGLAEHGLSLAVKEPYRLTDKEFRDKILKLRSADLTHLLIIGYGFLYPNIFREMKDQQLLGKVQIVGGWGFLYPNVPPADLQGVVVVGPRYLFSASKEVDAFYNRFSKTFGYPANFDAAMTYSAVQILAHGLIQANEITAPNLASALLRTSDFSTLIGSVTVSSEGAISFPVSVGTFDSTGILRDPTSTIH